MRCKLVLLVVVLALGLTGCMRETLVDPQDQGVIRIVINPTSVEPQAVGPKLIPADAEKVRIRVWHPTTGFNAVATVTIGGADGVDIPVPAGTGYTVDAVSYVVKEHRPLALTGGRKQNVAVERRVVTNVQIALRPWQTEARGDTTVEPEDPFVVEFVPTDGGGLLALQTFKEATLHTSTTPFDDPDDPLPLFPGSQGILFDDRITFTTVSPAVTELTVLFVATLVEFSQNWKDVTIPVRDEQTLYIEFPNRHMGEDLHQVTVDPTAGGLVVEITGLDPAQ
jgi:hypothetical protein